MRYRAEPEPTGPFSGEYGFLKIRYKLPDDNTSRLVTTPITAAASADSAAAVAAFGQSCETTARQLRPR
jgi:Ca-activated chloride channel homolog